MGGGPPSPPCITGHTLLHTPGAGCEFSSNRFSYFRQILQLLRDVHRLGVLPREADAYPFYYMCSIVALSCGPMWGHDVIKGKVSKERSSAACRRQAGVLARHKWHDQTWSCVGIAPMALLRVRGPARTARDEWTTYWLPKPWSNAAHIPTFDRFPNTIAP